MHNMAQQMNLSYYLIDKDNIHIKRHNGTPSKKFMLNHTEYKGYVHSWLLGTEHIEDTYIFNGICFEHTNQKIMEWSW